MPAQALALLPALDPGSSLQLEGLRGDVATLHNHFPFSNVSTKKRDE